jgi:hypothetical protein
MPGNMEDIYNDILHRIEEYPFADKDLAMRTLSWIFHTGERPGARRFKMDELIDLLITDEGDSELDEESRSSPHDIIAVCKSLVIHNEESGEVGFAHFSVHEYLRKRDLRPISYLAKICISYLSFDEFEKGECDSREALDMRLQKYKAGDFVSRFWGFYASQSEKDPDVQKAILNLLMSDSKRKSMVQLGIYGVQLGRGDWERVTGFVDGMLVLHVLARQGLTYTCGLLLDTKYTYV